MSASGSLYTDVADCLAQCKAHLGNTHNLDMDDWPVEICISNKTNADQTTKEMLQGRMVLVMCNTLGNWSPRVPQFIAEQCIVIYVKKCTRKNTYGFRACDFKWGDKQTWEEATTDFHPCWRFLKVVEYLETNYSISTLLSIVGVSAGVDQALSLVSATSTIDERGKFDIHSFTAVAGAYHPTLYEQCFDIFLADDTYVISSHDVQDRFCAWKGMKPLGSQFARQCNSRHSSCIHMVL